MGDRSAKNVLSRFFSNTNNNDATIRAKGNCNPALFIILKNPPLINIQQTTAITAITKEDKSSEKMPI